MKALGYSADFTDFIGSRGENLAVSSVCKGIVDFSVPSSL